MYADRSMSDDLAKLKAGIEELKRLSASPEMNLKAILDNISASERLAEYMTSYAHMKQDEDSRVPESQKQNTLALQTYSDLASASAFLNPYLLGLSDEAFKALLADEAYAPYRNTLEKIYRYKAHTLSEREEYVLSKMGFATHAPQDIYYFLTNADMTFPSLDSAPGETLSNATFTMLQKHEDEAVRKEVFEKYYSVFNSFKNTIATAYANNVKMLTTQAELRGFDDARQMELFMDDVDPEVYDALLKSIHGNIDLLHRYYREKKRLLGLEEQHMYDVYLPMIKGEQKTYTFEEAKALCIASVAPLGEEYQKIYARAFEENWVDVYPREGKRGGAYSAGCYDSKPYIAMNFNGTLNSVFTLAHEMGHSMHSYYTRQANSFMDYGYTIFAAEVASTFNENLLLHYLIEHAQSDAERLILMDHHLESFKSTVYRQAMFAEFEKIVHERIGNGEALTAADMDEIYFDLNTFYFGDSMISDELISHEWMRIPHFYNDFYVYKYATGYCASTVLSQRVLANEPEAKARYFTFLKDGAHHFPIDQLRMAGCDLSKPETVDRALGVFRSLVEQLERTQID